MGRLGNGQKNTWNVTGTDRQRKGNGEGTGTEQERKKHCIKFYQRLKFNGSLYREIFSQCVRFYL